jgi:inosine-uridine nucleoside N-ribohydrolase
MDLSMNLFPNQFNVALNRQAAQFVLQNTDKFSKFIVVPSHTAQNLKYPLPALQEQGGRSLGKKMLGFNWHADPLKIATEQVNLQMDEYSQKAFPMPDLTAFLCALLPDVAAPSLGFVRVDDTDNVLIFKPDVAGISMYDIKESSVLGADKVADIFGKLDEGRSWLDLD